MEDLLKDMLIGEKAVIPEYIVERIDLTLASLPEKHKRKRIKYVIAAASIAFALVIGTAAVSPAFAENIPIINSVFNYFYDKNALQDGYIKYYKEVNQTVTDHGISITINEVVYDGSTLSVGYTVKGEKKLVHPNVSVVTFKADGRDLSIGMGGKGEMLDDYTYVGIDEMNVARENIPNRFKLDFMITNIDEIDGNWNFKFIVSKENIEEKAFKVNTKVQFEDTNITISKVSFTPLNTTIIFNGVVKDAKAASQNGGIMKYSSWFLFDDKGHQIYEKGGSASGGNGKGFSFEKHFEGIKEIPKKLTVIPYEFIKNGLVQRTTKDLSGDFPIKISQGKMGSIQINQIEFLSDRTLVYYRTEGIAPMKQAQELLFVDEKGKEIWSKERHYPRNDGNMPNSFIMKFPAFDCSKKYKIGTINLDTYINAREDLKFTIPIRK